METMSSFHYDFILSKRSSLARVWLAAHWEKKLSKVQIFETNLQTIVQDILHPKTPIALRTSSHLLVGLVRIYSRKAKYLLKDCSDTLVNIKVAFRPGVSSLDKPAKQRKSVKEIVDCPLFITERVDLLDQWVPEVSNVELDCTLNQSRIEEITLQEEPMKVSSLEDYFDDEGFGEMDAEGTDITGRTLNSCTSFLERGSSFADSAYGTDDQALTETTSLTDYYSDPFSSTLTPIKDFGNSPSKKTTDQRPTLLFDLDADLHPEEYCITFPLENRNETTITEDALVLELDLDAPDDMEENGPTGESRGFQDTPSTSQLDKEEQSLKRSLEDQEDVVILDPVEISQKKAYSPRKRHKRKLLIDEVISIDRQVMYDNMSDPSRFLRMPDLAARSKKQMKQDERNQTLLSKGSILDISPALDKLFLESKCRKFSTSSNVSSEVISPNQASEQEPGQTGFENNEDLSCNRFSGNNDNNQPDELDFSEQFIPLQDTEYSSDEECPLGNRLKNNTLNEFDFADNTLTIEEQTDEMVDENISDDKFCSIVETTVLHSPPGAVTFRHVVGKDDGKLTRKTVARRFLKCLLMQRDARLRLEQKESFQEILLHAGLKHASKEA